MTFRQPVVAFVVAVGSLVVVADLSAQAMVRPRAGSPTQGPFGVQKSLPPEASPTLTTPAPPPSPPKTPKPPAPKEKQWTSEACATYDNPPAGKDALTLGDTCMDDLRGALARALGTAGIVGALANDASDRTLAKALERQLRKAQRDLSLADDEEKWAATMRLGAEAINRLRPKVKALRALSLNEPAPEPEDDGKLFTARADDLEAVQLVLQSLQPKGPPARNRVTRSANFIPSAGVSAGTIAPEVTLQAAEFFFTNRWRLYVRSTLPTTGDDEESDAADDAGGDGEADDAEAAAAVDESVKSALLDPVGGLLNISTGYFRKLPSPFLFGEANDAEHGLFLDARGGLRFVELPEETLKLKEGTGTFTPFYFASVGVRLILPVFTDGSLTEHAGGVEGHVGYMINRVADASASRLFSGIDGGDPVLNKTTHTVYASVAMSLTKLANIAVSGTVWANTKFDRRVVVTLNLVKPDDPAKKSEQ